MDWDNTLVDSEQNLLLGAKDAISLIREHGHRVVIHSCNNPAWIQKCLNEWGIVVDLIWDGQRKPNCDVFCDDKAWRVPYNGNWASHIDFLIDHLKDKDNRKW